MSANQTIISQLTEMPGRPTYTTKWHFRDPPIQKNAIFETPLYNKMPFSRPPYTKKCHFRDPPIQQNGIFKTPLYNKFSRFDHPIQKWPQFDKTPHAQCPTPL